MGTKKEKEIHLIDLLEVLDKVQISGVAFARRSLIADCALANFGRPDTLIISKDTLKSFQDTFYKKK